MKMWAAAVLSAALLELPFPLAGPMPPWRSIFAWFGLVPLLWAILNPATVEHPASLPPRISALVFVRRALVHGQLLLDPRHDDAATGICLRRRLSLLLIAFSLVLGLYFGLFGLGVMLVRRASGKQNLALAAAPFLWAALDLAAARITSVPWDQLGYSQVDNGFVNQLAPWTGVYGISFVLLLGNAVDMPGSFLPALEFGVLQCWLRLLRFWQLFALLAGAVEDASTERRRHPHTA